MADGKSLAVTLEEIRRSPLLQRTAIEKVLKDEDVWVHVAYIYIHSQVKKQNFRIKKDGTIDVRGNIGRLVVKLQAATGHPSIQFEKDAEGHWIRKEGL